MPVGISSGNSDFLLKESSDTDKLCYNRTGETRVILSYLFVAGNLEQGKSLPRKSEGSFIWRGTQPIAGVYTAGFA